MVGAVTEPGAGSNFEGIRVRAAHRRDHYVINRSKNHMTIVYLAGAVLVVAKTDPKLPFVVCV